MKQYEALIITPSQAASEGPSKPIFEELLGKQGGKLVGQLDMGRRRLGYAVNKIKDAHVTNFEFELTPEKVRELTRSLELSEAVLKYTLVMKPKAKKLSAKARRKPKTSGSAKQSKS